jgi:hypothetical protein
MIAFKQALMAVAFPGKINLHIRAKFRWRCMTSVEATQSIGIASFRVPADRARDVRLHRSCRRGEEKEWLCATAKLRQRGFLSGK